MIPTCKHTNTLEQFCFFLRSRLKKIDHHNSATFWQIDLMAEKKAAISPLNLTEEAGFYIN